jgi:hypothetical protein
MKEEYNKNMESLRKKVQTKILEINRSLNQLNNTVESQYSRTVEQWKIRFHRSKTK